MQQKETEVENVDSKQTAANDDNERFHGEHRSLAHKHFIHRRVLQRCKLEAGDSIKYAGRPGIVVDVATEELFDFIEWNDLECKCVEIFLYDKGESLMVHPSTLKRRV